MQRKEVDIVAVEVVEPISVTGQLLPDSRKSLFVRAAGILHPDLVELGFMQHRNPFAPFFPHLSQRVVHVTIVFEQIQRLLHGPLDLREFTSTGRVSPGSSSSFGWPGASVACPIADRLRPS